MIAIIGGSGLAQLPALTITHRQVVRTPYGEPSCALTFGQLDGTALYFWRGTATAMCMLRMKLTTAPICGR